jgi:hypothetical protein
MKAHVPVIRAHGRHIHNQFSRVGEPRSRGCFTRAVFNSRHSPNAKVRDEP